MALMKLNRSVKATLRRKFLNLRRRLLKKLRKRMTNEND